MDEDQIALADDSITDDDRTWAAIAYIFSPLAPFCLLLMRDKSIRPFIQYHNIHALCVGLILLIMGTPLVIFSLGIGMVIWLCIPYCAYKAYHREYTIIPYLTDFIKRQEWA